MTSGTGPPTSEIVLATINARYHVVQGTAEIISRFGDVAAVPKLFVFGRDGARLQTFYGAPPDLHDRIDAVVEKAIR